MRIQDCKVGEYYRFKDHPNYGYAKVVQIFKAGEYGNPKKYGLLKCEHTISKGDSFGFIRYFRPRDLLKDGENG